MSSTSNTYVYDFGLKSLLYTKFASLLGLDSISKDATHNMNYGIFQAPFDLALREASELRGVNFLEFISFYRIGTDPSWSRQRTSLARRGIWVALDDTEKSAIHIKAQPIDLSYEVYFWSKNLEKVYKCIEQYILWQQDNPKISLLYNDKYEITPDLHFGNIVDDSSYDEKYDKGVIHCYRMPIKIDGWVLQSSSDSKIIHKIVLTTYDKDDITSYSDIIDNPDSALAQALKFFRKVFYGINTANVLEKYFLITGNYASDLTIGEKVILRGSTANDGMYTIVSATDIGENTKIVVSEVPTDDTGDGVLLREN